MKILSIRQPWASLIVSGVKDVENRTWSTRYRGPLLIHAAQRADDVTSDEIERRFGFRLPPDMPLGGVVGVAELVDCVRGHASAWYAPAHWAFVLAGSRPLAFVKWKGSLSLRDAPADLLELLDLDQRAAAAQSSIDIRRSCNIDRVMSSASPFAASMNSRSASGN